MSHSLFFLVARVTWLSTSQIGWTWKSLVREDCNVGVGVVHMNCSCMDQGNSKRLLHRKKSHLPNSRCFQHFASGYEKKTHRIMLQKWVLFLNQYTSVIEDYFKSIYIW